MATPIPESQGKISPVQQTMLGSITASQTHKNRGTLLSIYKQMNIKIAETERKKAECRKKREPNKQVSELGSSSDEEEEFEDLPSNSSSTDASKSEEEDKIPP